MNGVTGTIIVLVLVLAIVGGIVFKLLKDKKSGKCSCGHNCGCCPNSSVCHSRKR
ncbi:MAG: FeoB-associated Cys-rich membrane protein [Oscillospiraceae bacterium]